MDLHRMPEAINEPVSVALWSNHVSGKIMPYSLYWHGKRYQIRQMGFHHSFRQGRTLVHAFSVTDGVTFFRLEMNTETLDWKLTEVESQGI